MTQKQAKLTKTTAKKTAATRTKARRQPAKPSQQLSHYSLRALKQLVVPHKANQYRPHLIRRYGLVAVLLLVIGMQAGYNFSTTGSVLGSQTDLSPSELLADTNRNRAQNQLEPLQLNDSLSQAAKQKANDMLAKQYWAHTSPDGTTPWVWFKKVDYDYSYAGENLAKNFTTADSATIAWMNSPDHRANILDKHYSEVGFATVEGELDGKPTTLTVALYAKPKQSTDVVAVASSNEQASHTVAIAESVNDGRVTAVQGATDNPYVGNISLVTRFGMAIQAFTPAAVGSFMLLLIAATVAFVTHFYRKKLPKSLRQSWYRHHGMIKLGILVVLCFAVLLLYSGGQI